MPHLSGGGYRNLVFEGGGPKDAAFAGSIEVFDRHGFYDDIRRVAGTSSGSITATLLACGAGPSGLMEAVRDTNFNRFVADKGGIFGDAYRMLCRNGIHTGNGFEKILKAKIGEYAGDASLTFAQLRDMAEADSRRFKHLSVVAANLSRQRTEVFDAHRTPDLPIWKAVRASMSIPLIFEPMKIDGDYFVDGGLAWAYPLDIYDQDLLDDSLGESRQRNMETLGFYLVDPKDKQGSERQHIKGIRSYFLAIASFLVETNNRPHFHPEDRARTVFIDDLGVSGRKFQISPEMVERLIQNGREATEAFLTRGA